MIWNMRRRKKKPRQLTWRFNEMIDLVTAEYTTNFTDGGNKSYTGIYISTSRRIMEYAKKGTTAHLEVYASRRGWLGNSYKKVTFEKEPTGELLAFLQKNATPL